MLLSSININLKQMDNFIKMKAKLIQILLDYGNLKSQIL